MLSKDRMPAVHWLTPAPFPFCVNIRAEQRKEFSSLTILRRFKTVQNRAAPKKQKIVVETGSTDWKTSELLPLSKRNKSEPNADWRGVRICCFLTATRPHISATEYGAGPPPNREAQGRKRRFNENADAPEKVCPHFFIPLLCKPIYTAFIPAPHNLQTGYASDLYHTLHGSVPHTSSHRSAAVQFEPATPL